MSDADRKAKTLHDIKADMSEVFDELRGGDMELKMAAELANIHGKYLKAAQLELAEKVFLSGNGKRFDKDAALLTETA